MSDDEDSGEGKVLGPMLDYTRYYPTTLPLHQPRHDGSEAATASEEVGRPAPLFLCTSSPVEPLSCFSSGRVVIHLQSC